MKPINETKNRSPHLMIIDVFDCSVLVLDKAVVTETSWLWLCMANALLVPLRAALDTFTGRFTSDELLKATW
jgi:hypothetical protein